MDLTRTESGNTQLKNPIKKYYLIHHVVVPWRSFNNWILVKLKKTVYVSCNPATMMRYVGILIKDKWLRLMKAGAMDMFPTLHMSSLLHFSIMRSFIISQ